LRLRKIISGGQAGADRAALDAAIALGIPHGGWAPKGRWAEDGPLARRYRVREVDSSDPAVRTEKNVLTADATLIISHGPLTGGSRLTRILAHRHQKPVLHIDLAEVTLPRAVVKVRKWLLRHRPGVLNVAGPRASRDAAIYDAVRDLLMQLFLPDAEENP
jgi:hypothetical protein